MQKILLTVYSLFLTAMLVSSQVLIEGKIINRSTSQPITYANIGIDNKNVGTISNTDGSFSIVVPKNLTTDTISFSSLGFSGRRIPVKYFLDRKKYTILLNEKENILPTVTIGTKRPLRQIFELGNKLVRGGVLQTDTSYSGQSIALLIENKEPYMQKGLSFPAFVEKARLRILRNNLKSVKFRVRLNDVDSVSGKPGKDLLNESIVVQSSMRKGWLEFDLSHLNFEISKPFFITFEQITDLQDRIDIADGYREYIRKYPHRLKSDSVELEGEKHLRQVLTGAIDLPGTFIAMSNSESRQQYYTCYTRETSFGEWEKVSSIYAATVSLSNVVDKSIVKNIITCKQSDVACRAEEYCKDFMNETGITGMQLAVSKNNKTVWSSNFGYADWENKVPVSDSTIFRINSISKSFTSLAIIKLISEGKLDLDAPVQKYVPEFPLKNYPISSRQIAGHLAGFRDYQEENLNDYIRTEHFTTAREALKIFKDDSLLFEPGTKFSYSSFGWNLLGAVIEAISGMTYLDYMEQNIFRALRLAHTSGDDIFQKPVGRSKFYDATGQENELGDFSYKYPAGGLLSTGTDLLKLGNELLYGRYFDSKTKPLLFQSQYTSDGKKTNYGIGWYTGIDKNGHRIWYHGGDSFSGSSYLIIYPDDKIVISFLANGQEGVYFNTQNIGELFYSSF
jgi:CubicO group peptidase (beta-lactamase class C family)